MAVELSQSEHVGSDTLNSLPSASITAQLGTPRLPDSALGSRNASAFPPVSSAGNSFIACHKTAANASPDPSQHTPS